VEKSFVKKVCPFYTDRTMVRSSSFRILVTLFSALAALFLCAAVVFAQGTSTPAREEGAGNAPQQPGQGENAAARRAEVASSSELRTEEFKAHKAALAEKLQNRIYNLTSNISRRMQAAVDRLLNIADRLDSRALKMQNAGMDTAAADQAIEEARNALSAANDVLRDNLGSFVGSDNPRQAFAETRTKLADAHTKIREARESLRTALRALKEAAAAAPGAGVSEAVRSDNATGTNPVSDEN
jgi:chromosome segregation ATPase